MTLKGSITTFNILYIIVAILRVSGNQGTINCKGTETFAKKPKLEKLARIIQQKKSTGFSRMSAIANWLRFGCLSVG